MDEKGALRTSAETGLCDLLSLWNCRGILPASSRDAVEFLKRHPACGVILDVATPIIDAVATLRTVKRVVPDVPVIMMSASMTSELQRHLFMNGANFCLNKPVDRQMLPLALWACGCGSGVTGN